jgi:predicted nucleic acid-binding protein
MRIIVSDTSCIIDLGKSSLMRAVLQLPYTFVMPDVLFDDELLNFGPIGKDELRALGFQVVELDPQGTSRAFEHFAQQQALAIPDCFALALAEQTADCILLTSDRALRRFASEKGIEVHGVLWTIDELARTGLATVRQLYDALRLLEQDSLVFLPKDELRQRIHRLQRCI